MKTGTRPVNHFSPVPTGLRGIGIFPGLPRLEAAFVAAELAFFLSEPVSLSTSPESSIASWTRGWRAAVAVGPQ